MIDTSHINLLNLIERDTQLKRKASTGGGEYCGPCPFCGGQDRFVVQPALGRWFCRYCTPNWQDAISYVRRRDGRNFREALDYLNLQDWKDLPSRKHGVSTINTVNLPAALQDEQWQQCAMAFHRMVVDTLWSGRGKSALSYLRNRGLSEAVIHTAGLGLNPKAISTSWGKTKVSIPVGIVIPYQIENRYWAIKLRQRSGLMPKYVNVSGGSSALYNADALIPFGQVIMVEGEFDALVLQACIPQAWQLVPVATGSVGGARAARWRVDLAAASRVLLAFDADEAGEAAAEWWQAALGDKAVRLCPTQHDVTDMVCHGENLVEWLRPRLT